MRLSKYPCGILCFVLMFGLGCIPSSKLPESSSSANRQFKGAFPIRATVTVGMVADLVREIGGSQLEVTQLLGAGVDPHLYKPTRDDVQSILKADIVFYSGLMLEGKMAETLEQLGKEKPVIPVAESLSIEQLGHDAASHAHPDPHVWMDVSLWNEVAKSIGQRLEQYDPAHADQYRERTHRLSQSLVSLHEYGKHIMSGVPAEPRILITSHDAFRYFAKAYGLNVEPVQGISTESEAGLRRITDLVDLIVQRNVRVVFIESSVPPESIEALVRGAAARQHKIEFGGELFSDAMGKDGTYEGTYIGMMDHNLTTIARALGSNSIPEGGFREFASKQ